MSYIGSISGQSKKPTDNHFERLVGTQQPEQLQEYGLAIARACWLLKEDCRLGKTHSSLVIYLDTPKHYGWEESLSVPPFMGGAEGPDVDMFVFPLEQLFNSPLERWMGSI